ncbi:nuclear transport factor 2 family protein [Sphingosinicella sp. BN140058]|uniref:nuclear transport factor 2 family protein n=1 Tax=Sphingosinicella sp. BN140058 TaxID=1892855 RepID=UPI0013EB8D2A|nr:nuclear transport factor 2 family protein [Sphingosinicella sp. BN140058]
MRRSTRATIISAALSWAVPVAASAPAPASPMERELLAFADRFDRAQLTKDRAALETMVADDLVFVEGSGRRSGKAAFILGWMGPDERYDPIVLVDRVVVPLGPDAGIVGAETILRGVSAGKPFSSHFRFADTFKRVRGRWQVVHIQVTRIPAPPNE